MTTPPQEEGLSVSFSYIIMKFSYSLIKQLTPQVKSKKELVEKLNNYSFETSDFRGDVFDASIPPNRFSDAASHWGIGKELSAISGLGFRMQNLIERMASRNNPPRSESAEFSVRVEDKALCPRYRAEYFDNIRVKSSPRWMQKILIDCGLRPVNNVVDIMNYAMLESGQPLHAFDFDKIAERSIGISNAPRRAKGNAPRIIARKARNGEKIKTLDGKIYDLDSSVLVIADSSESIAIAGIKGGKKAEVDRNTKRIIVEAANFDSVSIYKSSKMLRLETDASTRFSHNLSPELVAIGLNRAEELLEGIAMARPAGIVDVNFVKPRKTIIKFDLLRLNKFIGLDFDLKTIRRYLRLLGFKIKMPATALSHYPVTDFLVEAPLLRQDIETFEDLAEEIARLYGYNRLKSIPPKIHLIPSGFEDQIVLKDKIGKVLMGFGFSEVYNYSFIGDKDSVSLADSSEGLVLVENPISSEAKYLRPNLSVHLLRNVESNLRFFDQVKVFEIGKIFLRGKDKRAAEKNVLGLAIASKSVSRDGELFFRLKGKVGELFDKIGLADYSMAVGGDESLGRLALLKWMRQGEVLEIKSGGSTFGYLARVEPKRFSGYAALAEIDLGKLLEFVSEEHEYRPLPKYPSVVRDISISVKEGTPIGDVIQTIQEADIENIEDVDLVDEYEDSITLRILFQSEERTLTDSEVNKKMEAIVKVLKSRFGAKIR